jgi:hypothetical protein
MLAYFIWNILQNFSNDEILYVFTSSTLIFLFFGRESTVEWLDRLLKRIRLAPAK